MHTSPYAQTAPCDVIYLEFSQARDTLDVASISREDIETWIINRLAEGVGLDPQDIDAHQPCSAYGLDSLTGVTLVGDLELWLNVRLSPTLLWDLPSIDQLVHDLMALVNATPDGPVDVSEPVQSWPTGINLDPETAMKLLPNLAHLSDQEVETMLSQLAA